MVGRVDGLMVGDFPALKDLWHKARKDNLRLLASVAGWNILISVVPILIGIVAITLPPMNGMIGPEPSNEVPRHRVLRRV